MAQENPKDAVTKLYPRPIPPRYVDGELLSQGRVLKDKVGVGLKRRAENSEHGHKQHAASVSETYAHGKKAQ